MLVAERSSPWLREGTRSWGVELVGLEKKGLLKQVITRDVAILRKQKKSSA